MAFTIPETISARSGTATAGERKVFVALRDHLPEDYLVYYDVSVRGRHPDFLVIGPDLGLVVLEVKDWRLRSIVDVTADGVRLRQAGGDVVVVRNPMQQVREYTLATVDLLKEHPRSPGRRATRLRLGLRGGLPVAQERGRPGWGSRPSTARRGSTPITCC